MHEPCNKGYLGSYVTSTNIKVEYGPKNDWLRASVTSTAAIILHPILGQTAKAFKFFTSIFNQKQEQSTLAWASMSHQGKGSKMLPSHLMLPHVCQSTDGHRTNHMRRCFLAVI